MGKLQFTTANNTKFVNALHTGSSNSSCMCNNWLLFNARKQVDCSKCIVCWSLYVKMFFILKYQQTETEITHLMHPLLAMTSAWLSFRTSPKCERE